MKTIIKELMSKKGIDESTLTAMLDITEIQMSRLLSGQDWPRVTTLIDIAHALEATPNYILGWEDLSNITTPDYVLKLHEINSHSTSTTIFVTVNDIDQAIELVNAFNNQTSELVVEVRVSNNGIQNEGREE